MKILHLSSFDVKGGAARSAFRLHQGLQSIGVDSWMLVQNKSSDDPKIIGPKDIWEKGFAKLRPKLDELILQVYSKRKRIGFSTSLLTNLLAHKVADINPDIIHLHWVTGGFLPPESLKSFRSPLIWTLHDMWPFTGGCHCDQDCGRYKESCGTCPILSSRKKNDLSHWIWWRKKKAWQNLNLTIVTPSRWLADHACASSLFKNRRVQVIPYGLNIRCFKPSKKSFVRNIWSLPRNKKIVLFGADNATSNENKGFQFLQEAIKILVRKDWAEQMELMIFGDREPHNPPDIGIKVHYLGRLHDEVSLALLYAAADVFVAPSIQDNLPNTVMESLACGTPVVAFKIGGMPDLIEHKHNGYLAKPFMTDDLAHGINWILKNETRRQSLSRKARQKMEEDFALEIQAQKYLSLYEEVLSFTK